MSLFIYFFQKEYTEIVYSKIANIISFILITRMQASGLNSSFIQNP